MYAFLCWAFFMEKMFGDPIICRAQMWSTIQCRYRSLYWCSAMQSSGNSSSGKSVVDWIESWKYENADYLKAQCCRDLFYYVIHVYVLGQCGGLWWDMEVRQLCWAPMGLHSGDLNECRTFSELVYRMLGIPSKSHVARIIKDAMEEDRSVLYQHAKDIREQTESMSYVAMLDSYAVHKPEQQAKQLGARATRLVHLLDSRRKL